MENFRQTALMPAKTAPHVNRFAPGVLKIELRGSIGDDQPISLELVRRQVTAQYFTHIHVEITSPGGSAKEAFEVYDFLRAQPVPVSTHASGQCLSAAIVIFMAGEFRSAAADAEFLLHQASFGHDSLPERLTKQILREHADNLALTDRRIANLFANRTGWPVEWFDNEILTEDLLTIVDAIETGMVHEFDEFTQRVDPLWPDYANKAAIDRRTYFPSRYFTQAYFAACRTAGSLYLRETAS